ncbi:integrase catalytic domain-containing protein [Trichonephila clavipes]|nr:integrase catalytic domain-containing protein [Trichonephila clavipes]
MQWGHCPGKDNPADLLSRDSELCSEELEHRSSVHVAVTQQREALVDINRFSSLKKLLKTTAWVFRFVNNARNIYKSMDFYIVADKGIHWKFIVERAPWWDGFYERLVKTIKDPLRKILGRALLTFEELSTILSEVEVIVNHRPLTYVENDPGEPEPLTPAHFLELGYGDSKYPIHFIELIDATTAKESYKKRKTYRTLLLKQLWRRWKEQYLLQLKPANHFKTPSVHKNLKLNDVVLVEGNVKSKLLWELGIIKEIFIGRDDNFKQTRLPFNRHFTETPDSQTRGSRTAVHVLMGEKRKKCLERRNLAETAQKFICPLVI